MVVFGPDDVERSSVAEGAPLGVDDDAVATERRLALVQLNLPHVLHIGGVGTGPKDHANGAVRSLVGTGQEAAGSVVQ